MFAPLVGCLLMMPFITQYSFDQPALKTLGRIFTLETWIDYYTKIGLCYFVACLIGYRGYMRGRGKTKVENQDASMSGYTEREKYLRAGLWITGVGPLFLIAPLGLLGKDPTNATWWLQVAISSYFVFSVICMTSYSYYLILKDRVNHTAA